MTGVEGYVESAASGLIAGINAGADGRGLEPVVFPPETTLGSMAHILRHADSEHFQPMNANFGLFPPLDRPIRGQKRKK